MEIKSISQILDEVAKINGWDDFDSIHKKSTEKRNMIIAVNIAKKSAIAFEAQFQNNTDLITTEICVLRERVAELEGMLGKCLTQFENQAEQGRYPELFLQINGGNGLGEIKELINKGKGNESKTK